MCGSTDQRQTISIEMDMHWGCQFCLISYKKLIKQELPRVKIKKTMVVLRAYTLRRNLEIRNPENQRRTPYISV